MRTIFEFVASEQGRRYLYGIVIAVVPALTLLGLTVEATQAITQIAAAVLAVTGGAVAVGHVGASPERPE